MQKRTLQLPCLSVTYLYHKGYGQPHLTLCTWKPSPCHPSTADEAQYLLVNLHVLHNCGWLWQHLGLPFPTLRRETWFIFHACRNTFPWQVYTLGIYISGVHRKWLWSYHMQVDMLLEHKVLLTNHKIIQNTHFLQNTWDNQLWYLPPPVCT